MASQYSTLWNYLLGWVPVLPPTLSKSLIQAAWSDICEEDLDWSWLTVQGQVATIDAITTGALSVVNGSTTVTLDAAAKAALDLIAGTIAGYTIFIDTNGPPYYMVASYTVGATSTLELDRPYFEATNPTASYTVIRVFITVPEQNFVRWVTFVDPIFQYPLTTGYPQSWIDQRDPGRQARAQPLYLVSHSNSLIPATLGYPIFEMWPWPVTARQYYFAYRVKVTTFDDTHPLPFVVHDDLLKHRGLYLAYQWAEANKSRFPADLGKTDWRFMAGSAQAEYKKGVNDLKRRDGAIFNKQWLGHYDAIKGQPILDGKWLQQHASWTPSY